MILSAILDKSARVNFSKANQIARARRASSNKFTKFPHIYIAYFLTLLARAIGGFFFSADLCGSSNSFSDLNGEIFS